MQRVSVTEKDATDRVRCRHMINPSKGQPKEDEAVDTDQSAVDLLIGKCMSWRLADRESNIAQSREHTLNIKQKKTLNYRTITQHFRRCSGNCALSLGRSTHKHLE